MQKTIFKNLLTFNKKIFSVFLFTLFFIGFKTQAQNTASISGSIDKQEINQVQLAIDRLYLGKPEIITSDIRNGQFQFQFTSGNARIVDFIIGDNHHKIFIEPGNDLQLQIKDTSITFTGTGAEQNTFLNIFYKTFSKDFDDTLMQQQMLSTGVDAFEILIFENNKKENNFYKNYPDKNKFSSDFADYLQNTINYRYWNLLLAYPIINANSDSKIMTVNQVPAIMFDEFEKVKLNNNDAINSASYRLFLKYYVIYFTSQKNGFNKFTDFTVSADRKLTLAKEKLNGAAFNFWLAEFLSEECQRLSPYSIRKLITELTSVDKEGIYTAGVNEVCGERMAMKEMKEKKKEDKPSERKKDELDLTDLNGKHVSLSDFDGKVVYIDFWASWCGPCRKMMPFSKQLHAQLNEKQKKKIVFLYISIDADKEQWKKGIEDLGIEGVNVISPGNWQSKAVAYFQIGGIPRYMIMNKKGDIVDVNAARPADQSVLLKLLKLADE